MPRQTLRYTDSERDCTDSSPEATATVRDQLRYKGALYEFILSHVLDILPTEKLVLLYVANRYNIRKGEAWPSIALIARECGLSERQAQRVLRNLVQYGFMDVIPYFDDNGRQTSNRYRFRGEFLAGVLLMKDRRELQESE
jgi:hypothetical protein